MGLDRAAVCRGQARGWQQMIGQMSQDSAQYAEVEPWQIS
jgi:hypothetical protein